MNVYTYRRMVYKNGELIINELGEITPYAIEVHTRKIGREGLLELVNKWNRQGALGFEKTGFIYVYTAL